MPTHKECVNFSSSNGGYCNLKNKEVNPDDPACEKFVPHSSAHSNPHIDMFHLALGVCFITAGSLIIGHFVLDWF